MKSRGFTIIELLVVISVIGLFASIVLAALGGVRQKGQVAAVQQFVDNNYHVLGTSLIAWYGFNDAPTSGWSTTADLSGNNNPATIVSGVPPVSTTTSYSTVAGSAITISRSTHDVQFAPTMPANGTGITISMWIKLTQTQTDVNRYIFNDNASGIYLTLGSGAGNNYCAVYSQNADASVNNGVKNICDGNWHNITYTTGNNSSRVEVDVIYVDGKQDSVTTGSWSLFGNVVSDVTSATFPFTMSGDTKGGNWVGYTYSMDDIMIFDQALGFSGIVSLYDLGAAKHGLALK